MQAKEKLLKIVNRIVEERKSMMEKSPPLDVITSDEDQKSAPKDAVDVLLREYVDSNEKQSLPLDFISGNIVEMMIPGEETVPMAMTLAVKYLSDSPVALKKLQVLIFDPTARIISIKK